jgi:hypothetical protein
MKYSFFIQYVVAIFTSILSVSSAKTDGIFKSSVGKNQLIISIFSSFISNFSINSLFVFESKQIIL